MADQLRQINATQVLWCAADGDPVRGEREATDIIGDAMGQGADWVVLPVSRLTDEFFQLRTRVAGDIAQKFVTYRQTLVILGDVSDQVAASAALRDFVRESNRGTQLWFVADEDELAARLAVSC